MPKEKEKAVENTFGNKCIKSILVLWFILVMVAWESRVREFKHKESGEYEENSLIYMLNFW